MSMIEQLKLRANTHRKWFTDKELVNLVDEVTMLEAELSAMRSDRNGAREVALKFGEELNTLKELAKDSHVPLKELDSALKGIMIERQRVMRLMNGFKDRFDGSYTGRTFEILRSSIESGEQPLDIQ